MAKHRDSIARQSLIWNPEVKIKNAWRRDTVKVLKAGSHRVISRTRPKTETIGKSLPVVYAVEDGLWALAGS